MRTIRTLALAALALTLPVLVTGSASAASYSIDSAHTSVIFKVSHFGIAPLYGRFNKVSGGFVYDAAKPSASSLSVDIDVTSIFTADRKRDDHLKSPDFFSAKQFPTITIKSKRVTVDARSGELKVVADVTVRGVTKTLTFDVTKTGAGKDPYGNVRVGFEGKLTIDRMAFGVSYMPDGLGKQVTILFAVEGVKA